MMPDATNQFPPNTGQPTDDSKSFAITAVAVRDIPSCPGLSFVSIGVFTLERIAGWRDTSVSSRPFVPIGRRVRKFAEKLKPREKP